MRMRMEFINEARTSRPPMEAPNKLLLVLVLLLLDGISLQLKSVSNQFSCPYTYTY